MYNNQTLYNIYYDVQSPEHDFTILNDSFSTKHWKLLLITMISISLSNSKSKNYFPYKQSNQKEEYFLNHCISST